MVSLFWDVRFEHEHEKRKALHPTDQLCAIYHFVSIMTHPERKD